jgi:hypothetical protein
MSEGFGSKPTVTVGNATKKEDYDNLVNFIAGGDVQDGDAGIVLTTSDFGKTVRVNSSDPQTVDLPSVSADEIGGRFKIWKLGSGKMTVQAADSDIIRVPTPGASSSAGGTIYNEIEQYVCIVLELVSATEWLATEFTGEAWITT